MGPDALKLNATASVTSNSGLTLTRARAREPSRSVQKTPLDEEAFIVAGYRAASASSRQRPTNWRQTGSPLAAAAIALLGMMLTIQAPNGPPFSETKTVYFRFAD